MIAEHINPFLTSLANTMQTMLGCSLQRGKLMLKSDHVTMHDYSGVIGLTGKAVGTVVVSLSKEMAIKATCKLLEAEESEITPEDIIDAVGELANVVAGGAKAQLEEYEMSVSLPTVITGQGHQVMFPSEVTPLVAPYESAWGPLTLEFSMTPMKVNA